jgi:hypothetical protein
MSCRNSLIPSFHIAEFKCTGQSDWMLFRSGLPSSVTIIRTAGGVAALLSGLAVIPAAILAMMTMFMFDAPGSMSSPVTWGMVLGLLAAPLILFVSAQKGAEVVRKARPRDLRFALGLPAALAAWLLVMWLLLQNVCGGNFVCV